MRRKRTIPNNVEGRDMFDDGISGKNLEEEGCHSTQRDREGCEIQRAVDSPRAREGVQ